ncbi:hypothetical protein HERIO_371 [Hepatospora eriocheir]|uniref:Uncharacterized protein n=1 Tax=Hepatospora eriocheir TaxID=1081669 RepID=A0A1X0QDQ5_9MICR|nr:hypothetical protein HERIO_371 [Hepatospora eriocheir]
MKTKDSKSFSICLISLKKFINKTNKKLIKKLIKKSIKILLKNYHCVLNNNIQIQNQFSSYNSILFHNQKIKTHLFHIQNLKK